ncbi:MAG: thioesterase family protein [Trueperaceae bacterium]|nr:thioesterase family protein [Truepera sp.]HRN18957.1 thioesterase family protein [Trueperaceae bacterium]HRQ10431.1 thioesterase family protein [Trueperaceae bacterium]
MNKSASLDIQVRFVDTDALGHINNAVYATYAELGRVEFVRSLDLPPGGFILARLAIDYRLQVRLGQRVRVETWVERIGTSSVTMRQVVHADDEPAAEIEAVAVWFDYDSNRPAPFPAEARRAFEEYSRAQ